MKTLKTYKQLLTEKVTETDYELMFNSAIVGGYDFLKRQLEAGADPNTEHKLYNHSLLKYAINNSQEKIIKLLIDYGADINETDDRGRTLLIQLCSSGLFSDSEKMVKILIDSGADINKVDGNSNNTALMYAAKYNEMDLVKLLIDTNWTIQDNSGNTFYVFLTKKNKDEIRNLYPEKYINLERDKKRRGFNL